MMSGQITGLDVARYIVANIDRNAGESVTPLKLQKLLYYIQAWALVFLDRPLFHEDFEAWAHGPALDSVYQEYKKYGWNAIPPGESAELEPEVEEHIENILSVYGDCSAKHLEMMSHSEAPWREARGGLPPVARSTAIISKDTMKEFYTLLYESVPDGEEQKTSNIGSGTVKSGTDSTLVGAD